MSDVICLTDSMTSMYMFMPNDGMMMNPTSVHLVLPVPSGCSTVSVSVSVPDTTTDTDLYCLPSDPTQPVGSLNFILGRSTIGDDSVTFSACFPTQSYVHCLAQNVIPGEAYFVFSTMVEPFRKALSTPTAASLSYQEGLGAAAAVTFGTEQTHCMNYYASCYEWISTPTTDPLIFFPPASSLPKFNSLLDLYAMC